MVSWIDPIFDRTILDVEYVKQNLRDNAGYNLSSYFATSDGSYFLDSENRKIQLQATDDEHKGAYNASDFNRVNNDLLFLRDYLLKLGVSIALESADRTWLMEDIPTVQEFMAYLTDVETVRGAVSQSKDTPETPGVYGFDYSKANDIEKILYDTYMSLKHSEESSYYSGDIYAGEVI